jgi:hypothetical protein
MYTYFLPQCLVSLHILLYVQFGGLCLRQYLSQRAQKALAITAEFDSDFQSGNPAPPLLLLLFFALRL